MSKSFVLKVIVFLTFVVTSIVYLGARTIVLDYENNSLKRQLEQLKTEAKVNAGRPVSPDKLPPAMKWIRSYTDQVATVCLPSDDSVDLPGPYYSVYNENGKIPDHFTVEDGKIIESYDSGKNPFMGVTIPNPLN